MYRMVVQDKRTHPTKEKIIARLGSYNPHSKELNIDAELANKYLENGAQPSDRSIGLLKQAGVKLPAWVKEPLKKAGALRNPDKLRANQVQEEEAPVEDAADAEPAEEVAAEETKDEPVEA
jgi:small subunit ribosomal protein S16